MDAPFPRTSFPVLPLLAIAILLFLGWFLLSMPAPSLVIQGETGTYTEGDLAISLAKSHAVAEHGAEAYAARQCFQDNGPSTIFRNGFMFTRTCIDAEGNRFVQVLRNIGKGLYEEITAYKDGWSWKSFLRYEAKHGFTEFTGPMP